MPCAVLPCSESAWILNDIENYYPKARYMMKNRAASMPEIASSFNTFENMNQQHQVYVDQQQQPQVPQTTVVYVTKPASSNQDSSAGIVGCCIAFFFTPFIALCGLFCFSKPRHRALLLLFAGIGGLSWLLVWFPIGLLTRGFRRIRLRLSSRL